MARVGGSGEPSLAALIDAHDAENHRLSAALHDDPVQLLTVAVMRLDLLAAEVDDERAAEMAREVQAVVRTALARIRDACVELDAPLLERDGIAGAISEHADRVFAGTRTRYDTDAQLGREPTRAAASLIYRAAREAIDNARQHSGASNVHITLRDVDGGFEAVVRDDGNGFTPSPDAPRERGGDVVIGLALAGDLVTSAGGRWSIESAPGSGAAATYWVPADL